MSLVFQLETKPKYKSVTVYGVEIPLYGDITVEEAIAEEKAVATEADQVAISNTEWKLIRVAAWLSVRLGVDKATLTAQLKQSKGLIDALWDVFYNEKESDTKDYELEEVEGKDNEDTVPLKTSRKSGTPSTSNLPLQDLAENSLVVLDNSLSA